MFRRLISLFVMLMMLSTAALAGEVIQEVEEDVLLTADGQEIILATTQTNAEAETAAAVDDAARSDLIDRYIAVGKRLYDKANGRPMKAASSGDIYVCKNFTTYVFREVREDFRMAEYPDVTLRVPDNMPAEGCEPYKYGLMWKDVPASEGNAFYAAAEFRYNNDLSYKENLALAEEFMRNVQRGDYFQMCADYYYGVGAHSAIMIADWDPETDTVRWMDSNMAGKRINGVRHGYVQYDKEKSVSWWADAFCHKRMGATIYRLREDIIYAE